MKNFIRLGTRQSPLAIWQAEAAAAALGAQGLASVLVGISSLGDRRQAEPIYKIGISGVFTRELDAALLAGEIDAAVHSYKDVPTVLADGLVVAAVLPRGAADDALVLNKNVGNNFWKVSSRELGPKVGLHTEGSNFFKKIKQTLDNQPLSIATSSLRRRAQWLSKFPATEIRDVRGNIGTRLDKLERGDFDGIIMARAALERLDLWENLVENRQAVALDWLLSAPAQGAIVVVCRENEDILRGQFSKINCRETAAATQAERDFMAAMQVGCSMPIAAFAEFEILEKGKFYGKSDENLLKKMHLKVGAYSLDGRQHFEIENTFAPSEFSAAGATMAARLLENTDCKTLIEKMQNDQNPIHAND